MYFVFAITSLLAISSNAEVPQEHSHDIIVNAARNILQKSSAPVAKVDVVFGLLGIAAATSGIAGAGLSNQISQACLHQDLADACLTTAKTLKLGNAAIMTCIQYQALERNTGTVGLASAICTTATANPEIASIKQHQDPASANAQAGNGAIELAVAKQALALGFSASASANFGIQTATFAAGSTSDTSGRGNACDTIPSFQVTGGQVPPVFATTDGKQGSQGISGTVLGRVITAGQLIDCTTLAALTNDVKHTLVPAMSAAQIITALGSNSSTPPPSSSNSNPAGSKVITVTVTKTLACSATAAPITAPTSAPSSSGSENLTGLKNCPSPLNGTLCTTAGNLSVASKASIIASCNACSKKDQNAGDAANKLSACLAKVNGGDRNPNQPFNTFGRNICS